MKERIKPSIHKFLLRYDTLRERSKWILDTLALADKKVNPNLEYSLLLEEIVKVCIQTDITDVDERNFFVDKYGFAEIPFCSDEYMEEYYSIE